MTGREQLTLNAAVAILERVETTVGELGTKIDALDVRVRSMETANATQVGVAAGSAAAAAANEKKAESRSMSFRAWIAIGVAATAALTTLLLKVLEITYH